MSSMCWLGACGKEGRGGKFGWAGGYMGSVWIGGYGAIPRCRGGRWSCCRCSSNSGVAWGHLSLPRLYKLAITLERRRQPQSSDSGLGFVLLGLLLLRRRIPESLTYATNNSPILSIFLSSNFFARTPPSHRQTLFVTWHTSPLTSSAHRDDFPITRPSQYPRLTQPTFGSSKSAFHRQHNSSNSLPPWMNLLFLCRPGPECEKVSSWDCWGSILKDHPDITARKFQRYCVPMTSPRP